MFVIRRSKKIENKKRSNGLRQAPFFITTAATTGVSYWIRPRRPPIEEPQGKKKRGTIIASGKRKKRDRRSRSDVSRSTTVRVVVPFTLHFRPVRFLFFFVFCFFLCSFRSDPFSFLAADFVPVRRGFFFFTFVFFLMAETSFSQCPIGRAPSVGRVGPFRF